MRTAGGERDTYPVRTCYDCIHLAACKWTPVGGHSDSNKRPPMEFDAQIKPFLTAVAFAFAEACREFWERT